MKFYPGNYFSPFPNQHLHFWFEKSLLFHFFYVQLLKIERVSESGVKQMCISEVSFASLVAMPESDSSLPKLSFPKENARKKEKVCNFINL